jgi:two-component system, chemotaxis family, response regulator Rcp1
MGNGTLKILLVEDNEGDALLLRSLLRGTGRSVDVQVVSDGEAAMDFLCRRGDYADASKPDAVLLDINLPKKNGFEVLTEMRRIPELKRLPVLMLTGSANKEDIVRAYTLEIASFITKPSQLNDYEDLVKRILAVDLPRVLEGNAQRI